MKDLTIAAAQIIPKKGDISSNLKTHAHLIETAAGLGTQIIVFPELSITGYEPQLASELAFTNNDPRLDPLRKLSQEKEMIIVVGAPAYIDKNLHIGSFILFPDKAVNLYTKHYLHPGEERFFNPGVLNPMINFDDQIASIAICADITNPVHAEKASINNTTLYLSSVFITDNGYENDTKLLRKYAKQYGMVVLMANFEGESGGFKSAGRSAIWSDKGELIEEFDGFGEGLVVAERSSNHWKGITIKK